MTTPADAAIFEGHFKFGTSTSHLSWQHTSSVSASMQRTPQPLTPHGFSGNRSALAATDLAVLYGMYHTVLDLKWIILLVENREKGERKKKRIAKANTIASLVVSSTMVMGTETLCS